MTYIYWLPALLGYFSVAAFASFENLQTTRIEHSTQACVQNSKESQGQADLSKPLELKSNRGSNVKESFCGVSAGDL